MRKLNQTLFLGVAVIASLHSAAAQRIKVKIVGRESSETNYRYTVLARYGSTSSDSAHCYGTADSVNCNAKSRTDATASGPKEIAYSVTGATFSLLLPDNRLVVVNCVSKYRPRGDHINRRSCRTPLMDDIEVEFNGKKAKLFWPVSLDGKKVESETYNMLAVFPPENQAQREQ